jgi:hypothetical protein
MRYRNKVHILSYILFLISISFVEVKIQMWRHYFSNTLRIMFIALCNNNNFYRFVMIIFISPCNDNLYLFVIIFMYLNDFISICDKLLAMLQRHHKPFKLSTI